MKTYLEPKEIEQIEQAAECLRDKLLVRLLARVRGIIIVSQF